MMDGKIVTNDDPMLRWYMHNVRLVGYIVLGRIINWVIVGISILAIIM